MSTDIRPELSKRNKYWINKNRYYELKHFCLQYKYWKDLYSMIDGSQVMVPTPDYVLSHTSAVNVIPSDPTGKAAEGRLYLKERINMIETAAKKTDPFLADYILKAVTEELSYDSMRIRYSVPCCRDKYYEQYRKFFWILDKLRI